MSLIGRHNSTARCAEFLVAICAFAIALDADCPPSPASAQQAQIRLQELDRAAQTAMQEQQFTEALRDFQEIVCVAPDNAQAFHNLGAAQAASGDLSGARRSFATSHHLDPSNVLSSVMLVRVNASLGDIDALKSMLREIATRFPRDGALHGSLARFLAEKKQLDLALAELLRAKRAGNTDSAATLELAILENSAGAHQEAVVNAVVLERNRDLADSTRAAAAGIAGLSFEELGKREEAIIHLREAIRLDPTRDNSYLALAYLLEKAQRFAGAVEVLEQVRRNVPDSTAFLLPLGSDLARIEKYPAAIDALREAVRRSPNQSEAYVQLADAFRNTGSPREELAILNDLARLKPDYPMIHVLIARAILNADQPDYSKALEELAQAEKSASSDADVFYLRGKVYAQLNHNDEAVESFRRAIDLRPMDSGLYYQLGRLYQKLGKPELAKEVFDRMRYLQEANIFAAKAR
jgi:tetratricopeptide (TPR) repeat protein